MPGGTRLNCGVSRESIVLFSIASRQLFNATVPTISSGDQTEYSRCLPSTGTRLELHVGDDSHDHLIRPAELIHSARTLWRREPTDGEWLVHPVEPFPGRNNPGSEKSPSEGDYRRARWWHGGCVTTSQVSVPAGRASLSNQDGGRFDCAPGRPGSVGAIPVAPRPDPVSLLGGQVGSCLRKMVPNLIRTEAGLAVHGVPRGRPYRGTRSVNDAQFGPARTLIG